MPGSRPCRWCSFGVTTVTAAVLSIQNIFWPLTSVPGKEFTGYLDTTLMTMFIVGVVIVVFEAVRRCVAVMNGAPPPPEAFGPPVIDERAKNMRCC